MIALAAISRRLLPVALTLLFRSLRITIASSPDNSCLPERDALFTFWHGKMIAGWLLARKLFPGRTVHAVVSLSKDGSLLSDALAALGYSLIRGSSSKKSEKVRDDIASVLQQGGLVAITPDGPGGPLHQFKYGSLRIASRQGTPLLFASIRYSSAWKLDSWDLFEIPKPFSRVNVILHRIDLPKFGSEDELRHYGTQLSEMLGNE